MGTCNSRVISVLQIFDCLVPQLLYKIHVKYLTSQESFSNNISVLYPPVPRPEVRRYVRNCVERLSVEPNLIHYACLVSTLPRQGEKVPMQNSLIGIINVPKFTRRLFSYGFLIYKCLGIFLYNNTI